MLRAFRGAEDVRKTYNVNNSHRNISNRNMLIHTFKRQPRPQLPVYVYAPARCVLFQADTHDIEITMDFKFDTKRKAREFYYNFRNMRR